MNALASSRLALAAVFVVMSFGALAADRAPIQGGKIYGNAGRGQAIFTKWCTSCHAAGATASDQVPTLRQLVTDPVRTDGVIRAFLNRPHAPMPPVELSNQQIEDVVTYLHAQKSGSEPGPGASSP